jgi:hypothetical protein
MLSAGTAVSKTVVATNFMRQFTVDEANALIPVLSPVLDRLHDTYIRMQEAAEVVRAFEWQALQDGHATETRIFDPDVDLEAIQEEMASGMAFIRELGVVLKDIELGLVDFPARLHGRDVYLCWHLGEERVGYWHDVDGGYRQRQPL